MTSGGKAGRPSRPRALTDLTTSLGGVLRNPALRRVQLATLVALVGDGAYLTAVTVWAFEHGGARAVGLFVAAFMIAGALTAPLGTALGDRFPRRAVLVACDGARLALVLAAVGALGAEAAWPVYVLAVATGVFTTPRRSTLRAWVPALARTPAELTASNATASTVESLAVFVGPALGALVLVVADTRAALGLYALALAGSVLLLLTTRARRPDPVPHDVAPVGPALVGLMAGFRLVARHGDLRSVAAQVAAQTFVNGATRVFLVVVAVEVMGTGARGVGLLDAVIGVGSVVGGVVALTRVTRLRLGRDLAAGIVMWGAPLALVAAWPHPVCVVVALLLLGTANPLVDVNTDTILQRMTPDRLLARAFGAVDTCGVTGKALGSVCTPVLLHLVGLRWTLVLVGLPAVAVGVASWRRMARLDRALLPPEGTDLLRGVPWFSALPPAVLEALARSLREVRATAGTVLIAEGDVGRDFFVVESGTVRVTQQRRLLREQGPGDYFGEIALLDRVPRTATVTATSDVVLRSLDRDTFLAALTGDGLRQAGEVAAARLRHTG